MTLHGIVKDCLEGGQRNTFRVHSQDLLRHARVRLCMARPAPEVLGIGCGDRVHLGLKPIRLGLKPIRPRLARIEVDRSRIDSLRDVVCDTLLQNVS